MHDGALAAERERKHPALAPAPALNACAPQIPVYIWAPEEEGQFQPGRCLRWWLHSSLRAFERDLAALGSRMVYAKAPESRLALVALARELGAQGVLFNHLYDPISMVGTAAHHCHCRCCMELL